MFDLKKMTEEKRTEARKIVGREAQAWQVINSCILEFNEKSMITWRYPICKQLEWTMTLYLSMAMATTVKEDI